MPTAKNTPKKFGSFKSFSYLCRRYDKYLAKTMTVRRKRVSGCSGNGNRVWRRKPR